ncbi:MAG: hypothetical protein U0L55_05540 [Acutalibacteraceae bacterium]|nr:hypothetical protein [Acutalibacteraceae bacterium]
MNDDKWNEFLKNGSVLAYLSYVAEQKNSQEAEGKIENSNSGTDNQRNQYR